MSVFDLPRLHFAGLAVTRLPTGPRDGLLDLTTNQVLTDDGPFPPERPVQEYYDFLHNRGERYEPDGEITPQGRFGTTKGWNFGGNGHFWIDAKVVGHEGEAGRVETTDPLVGRQLDLWGHYCEYTAGTANRARVFDVDPSSNWTTTVMVGHLALGRSGRSHEVGYLMTGDVNGMCPPRWQNSAHILDVGEHPLSAQFRRSVVHQFVVDAQEGLYWLDGAEASPALTALRALMDSGAADGLVVQMALFNMATPTANDEPDVWNLRGTIAPWHSQELRTYPAGRLLTGRRRRSAGRSAPLHNLTVRVDDTHVTANLITALPVEHRAPRSGPGPAHRLGAFADLGDLELRTASGTLLATIPGSAYLDGNYSLTSGVLTVPRVDGGTGNPSEALRVTSTEGTTLLDEEETVVQSDEACLFLEHPNARTGEDFAVEIPLRSYVRGEPARVDAIQVRQFFNPRGLPLDEAARSPDARPDDVHIVSFLRPGRQDCATRCVTSTDEHGHGKVTVKGARGGATRVLLLPEGEQLPADPDLPGSAAPAYDNDDELGYWSGVGSLAIRVLPDHWYLDELPDSEITFQTVYNELLAYYELKYSFMRSEVLSLADEFKVEPYARLIWHVSDSKHKDKTFYMPPTRDMSAPQTRLLLRYLLADEAKRQTPPRLVPHEPKSGLITTRDELLDALHHAARIELATMIQYLYAAYSIPIHGAARHYVASGEWTEEQLQIACGEGTHTLRGGIRGSLMNVAREEMMHFLAINNIIMAMGRPFFVPPLDFGEFNRQTSVPLEFSLEPFSLASVQRFVALEQPHDLAPEVAGNDHAARTPDGEPYPYSSLSELYAAIREGIPRVPGAFLVKKGRGGGAHHLFMRESVNAVHPDYQLEVDDVASAVFAIDFVTEHGEGGSIPSVLPEEESHFDTFLRISELLVNERALGPTGRRIPWNPAYPVVRNPTLASHSPGNTLVTHEPARLAMTVFNRSYFIAMQLMVQHFGYSPDKNLRRSRLMNWALDVMTGVLRPVGELIVTLPAGRPGRTAGPSFELGKAPEYISRPDVATEWMARELHEIAQLARKCTGLTPTVADLLAFIGDQLRATDPQDL
ncbi:ferritin-like domain-containing protein [Streptomyces sp. NBC_00878]|uniref:ferritin-like domain-containing protein n=1 Tax=Streptomyces sp. NBC_00878 TaxID=2975854 RepID=UPI002250A339|nr:ferritin-like domain-containing protein [Streptomyces sp. NBC_00878]MCX4904529.1 ferritin-like protein [Streptomyces sp. NBC_00878]